MAHDVIFKKLKEIFFGSDEQDRHHIYYPASHQKPAYTQYDGIYFEPEKAAPKAAAQPKCKTIKQQAGCEGRTDCSWVAESKDAKGKVKAKAYCRAKPKEAAKKAAPKEAPKK